MRSPIRSNYTSLFLLALLATLAVTSVAYPFSTSNGVTDCQRQPLSFIETISVGMTTVNYTVPPGREFVVTDLTVTNIGPSLLSPVRIQLHDGFPAVGTRQTAHVNVPQDETIHVNYTAGPRFSEGEQILIFSSYGNTKASVHMAGYEVLAGCGC